MVINRLSRRSSCVIFRKTLYQYGTLPRYQSEKVNVLAYHVHVVIEAQTGVWSNAVKYMKSASSKKLKREIRVYEKKQYIKEEEYGQGATVHMQ
ncbi:hypothetical protein ES703_108755 [subsurface metagenome]